MELGNIDTTELIALVGALGALAAVIRQDSSTGQRPVFNIGEGFGQSDSTDDSDDTITSGDLGGDSADTVPDELPDPSDTWEYEDPTEDPDSEEYEDPDLDFGDADPGDPTDATIPDSLAGFDPAGRAGLIDDDNQVGL
jgi:hypothetical protein